MPVLISQKKRKEGNHFFNIHPRSDWRTLYGRSDEIKKLENVLENGGWATVLGPKMVGKNKLIHYTLL